MMTTQAIPYLVFAGNCKEAMEFYKEVFDGEISIMTTFGESPMEVPADASDRIFNSELNASNFTLKASDDMPGYEVEAGTNFSLYLTFESEELKKRALEKLADGGKVLFPVTENFGMVRDQFGIQWMVIHAEGV